MRLFALIFAASVFILQGCASGPKGPPFTPIISASDVAVIYVYRLNTTPYLRKPDLKINGVLVAEIPTNSYTALKLKPGKYLLKTNWNGPLSIGLDGAIMNASTTMNIVAGKSYYAKLVGELGLIIASTPYQIEVLNADASQTPQELNGLVFVEPKSAAVEPQ